MRNASKARKLEYFCFYVFFFENQNSHNNYKMQNGNKKHQINIEHLF